MHFIKEFANKTTGLRL